jgi:hypothetical protein
MTDQRTLKKIINDQRFYIATKEAQISILAGKIETTNNILADFPEEFPLNKNKKGDIEIWKFEMLKDLVKQARYALSSGNETK